MGKTFSPHRTATPTVPVHRKTYVRIDPKFLRVCITCKRKNARVQLVRMIRAADGHVKLERSAKGGVHVCDRRSCIEKALEKKKFDYWVKIPLGQDIKKSVLSTS